MISEKIKMKEKKMYKKTEVYCSCGKFLYYIKNGWLHTPKGVKVSSDGVKFIITCTCNQKTEVKIK